MLRNKIKNLCDSFLSASQTLPQGLEQSWTITAESGGKLREESRLKREQSR